MRAPFEWCESPNSFASRAWQRAQSFGETMVAQTHTGVDEGDSDASERRIADLRAQDDTGRDCSEPDYAPSTSQYDVDVELGDDDDGLPDGALTGGYCARKWWC